MTKREAKSTVESKTKSPAATVKKVIKAPPAPIPTLPKSQFGVTLSLPPQNMELPIARKNFALRAKAWQKELEAAGHLQPDNALLEQKNIYYSTGLGDFNKVATWAQYCGVQLLSDLANIDRQRYVLIAVEQISDTTTYIYGLLNRENGQIRHQFNLVVQDMGKHLREQHINVPSWMDLSDLDHYRLG